jgi:drug/metabolite transporter (DMT)-like permease
MTEHGQIDAAKLICADLERQQQRRRRHFLPALAIVVLALGGGMTVVGLRPDLLAQPWWQLALQCVLWLLCLIVFPAIGLGLLFPSRGVRIGLAAGAVGLTVLATLGLPGPAMFAPDDHGKLGCSVLISVYGTVVLLMGILSGAFVQRRKTAAVYWIAAGIALTGLTAITWQCPVTGVSHILPSHLGMAAALMLATSLIGLLMHRRRDGQPAARE